MPARNRCGSLACLGCRLAAAGHQVQIIVPRRAALLSAGKPTGSSVILRRRRTNQQRHSAQAQLLPYLFSAYLSLVLATKSLCCRNGTASVAARPCSLRRAFGDGCKTVGAASRPPLRLLPAQQVLYASVTDGAWMQPRSM